MHHPATQHLLLSLLHLAPAKEEIELRASSQPIVIGGGVPPEKHSNNSFQINAVRNASSGCSIYTLFFVTHSSYLVIGGGVPLEKHGRRASWPTSTSIFEGEFFNSKTGGVSTTEPEKP